MTVKLPVMGVTGRVDHRYPQVPSATRRRLIGVQRSDGVLHIQACRVPTALGDPQYRLAMKPVSRSRWATVTGCGQLWHRRATFVGSVALSAARADVRHLVINRFQVSSQWGGPTP